MREGIKDALKRAQDAGIAGIPAVRDPLVCKPTESADIE